MKRSILELMLDLGIHGTRHNVSQQYLNLQLHHSHRSFRMNHINSWDWDNNWKGNE